MLEALLQKRTVLLILIGFITIITATTAILKLDYTAWLRGSILFSFATILGMYFGQLTTAYKIRHVLETQVDDLMNNLAIPKMTRIDDPNLETEAFLEFGERLLELLCEDFEYDAGVISIWVRLFWNNSKAFFFSGIAPFEVAMS